MKTWVLLHFEPKNDVTIIIKLHKAIRLRLVALYKNVIIIARPFLCSTCNKT